MTGPTWRDRLGAYLSSDSGRLALGVFLVASSTAQADRWEDDLVGRLLNLGSLLVGCYLVGRAAA